MRSLWRIIAGVLTCEEKCCPCALTDFDVILPASDLWDPGQPTVLPLTLGPEDDGVPLHDVSGIEEVSVEARRRRLQGLPAVPLPRARPPLPTSTRVPRPRPVLVITPIRTSQVIVLRFAILLTAMLLGCGSQASSPAPPRLPLVKF